MSEHSFRRWESWTPDAPAAVFFRDRKESTHRETLHLLHAEFSCNKEEKDFAFRVALQCSREQYQRIEAARWFNIPVGFSRYIGVKFQESVPIQITANFTGWSFYRLLSPLPVPDLTACLEQLLVPLLNEEQYNMVACGLSYDIVHVVQTLSAEEQIGFSKEGIRKAGF